MKLETERLILRPYEEDDLNDYFNILSNTEHLYYLDDIVTKTLEEAKQSLDEAIALMNNGMARRFAIILKSQPERVVGGVGYDITDTTPLGRVGHIGWFIQPEYQSNGYVTEAAKRVLVYAFTDDNCVRVTTGCYKENSPTQRVMAKIGFRQEADKPKAQYHDGVMKDRLEFAINKNEFEKGKMTQ